MPRKPDHSRKKDAEASFIMLSAQFPDEEEEEEDPDEDEEAAFLSRIICCSVMRIATAIFSYSGL